MRLFLFFVLIATPVFSEDTHDPRPFAKELSKHYQAEDTYNSNLLELQEQTAEVVTETRKAFDEQLKAVKSLKGDFSSDRAKVELLLLSVHSGILMMSDCDSMNSCHAVFEEIIPVDIEKIESLLSPEEKALLKNPQDNAVAIVSMLSKKLYGDADEGNLETPRPASSFFAGQSSSRGCCRHKAFVLKKLAEHYGIEAKYQTGHFGYELGTPNHVWLTFPKLKVVADPAQIPGGAVDSDAHARLRAVTKLLEVRPAPKKK